MDQNIQQVITIKSLSISIKTEKKSHEFINDLERLCKKYAVESNYFFNFKQEEA